MACTQLASVAVNRGVAVRSPRATTSKARVAIRVQAVRPLARPRKREKQNQTKRRV